MQLRKTLLVGLVASVLLAGCSSEQDTVVVSPLPQVENQFNPSVAWDKSVGNGIGEYYSHLSPAWADNTVYVADRFGLVKALDIETGKEIWSVSLEAKTGFLSSNISALLSGGLTLDGNKLYVGTENAKVFALDIENGDILWVAEAAGEVLSHPVVNKDAVIIHTSNGMLQALNSTEGKVMWTLNLDTPSLSVRGESAPAIAYGDVAIVGGDNGRVSAVVTEQGQLIWQQRISQVVGTTEIDRLNDVDMTPIVDNDVIYAIAYNGNLVALDLRSGQIIWKRDLGSVNNMSLYGGILYLVDQNDQVLAIRTVDGVTEWAQDQLLHRELTAPTVFNGYLVAGDAEGYLHWMDITDGHFVAQNKVNSSGMLARPMVVGDKLMVQAKNGKVYLYEK